MRSPSPSKPDWRAALKARRYGRIGLAAVWLSALAVVCLVAAGLAGWVWMRVLNDAPPWDLLSGTLFALEAPVFLWLARKGPMPPAPGDEPETMAADAFFKTPKRRP